MRRTTRSKISGIAAVGMSLAIGMAAFAGFTDTESASRSVDNGQLDIQMSPFLLSTTDIAPGDIMSRGLVIDFPTATNDGDLVQNVDLAFAGSTADFCEDVNATCGTPTANLLDGRALSTLR